MISIEKNSYEQKNKFSTPILFLVFNRIEPTKVVFKEIKKVSPSKLYIASDGPRLSKDGEFEKVLEIREYLLKHIDWECEVNTMFRDENLGCKYAVSSAITWFFNNEEAGIVLEDDCLPSQSFFFFCEKLLDKYKDNFQIGHIGGSNFQNGVIRGDGDYYFSNFNHIWGWASWANRWSNYNVELNTIEDSSFIDSIFPETKIRVYWKKIYKKVKQKKIDTWDYQWTFTLWHNNQISILPNFNLVSNIGFGIDATHTKSESIFSNLPTHIVDINNHPTHIEVNYVADLLTSNIMFGNKFSFKNLINKIKFVMNSIKINIRGLYA